jgi:hypothetical protein
MVMITNGIKINAKERIRSAVVLGRFVRATPPSSQMAANRSPDGDR